MLGEWLSDVNVSLSLSILIAILSSPLIRLLQWLEKFEDKLKKSEFTLAGMRMAFYKKMLFYPIMIVSGWAFLAYFFLPFAVFATWAEGTFQREVTSDDTNLKFKGMVIFACWLVVFAKVGWFLLNDFFAKNPNRVPSTEYYQSPTKTKIDVEGEYPSYEKDELWKFKIKDLFPHTDNLSRYVLMVLTANEDLSNFERLKYLLESKSASLGNDEITLTKQERSQFFLYRLRLGFLHNVWNEIFEKGQNTSSFAVAISELDSEVSQSYEEFRRTIFSCRRTKGILEKIRNESSFHYDQKKFNEALEIGAENPGEIIVEEVDAHFIVAYHVLDLVQTGRLSPAEIAKVREEIELIQNKFHAFVAVLFPAYLRKRSLMGKVEVTRS
ncbi:hypothetical protein PJI16_15545 [Nitrospira sp. MA-1]|nr:hypothetical protein [Nitrospira sp. MA-1]